MGVGDRLCLQRFFEDGFDFVGVDTAFVYFFVADVERGHVVIVVLVGDVGMLGLFDCFDNDVFVFRPFFQFVDVTESPFAEGTERLIEKFYRFHIIQGLGFREQIYNIIFLFIVVFVSYYV